MDLEGQRVVSCRAGCTKSRIWEDRIKRFVRSPGSQAVEEAKEGQREGHEEGERDGEIDREIAGRRNRMARREKPVLIVGETSPLSRGYTMNTRGDGKAFRDPDGEGERSVDGAGRKRRRGRGGEGRGGSARCSPWRHVNARKILFMRDARLRVQRDETGFPR